MLKRWRLNWADLWVDGSLCFYKSDSRRELEHRLNLKTACVDVRCGLECGGKNFLSSLQAPRYSCHTCAADQTPPENHPRENRITVLLRDGSVLNLCASSEDESL